MATLGGVQHPTYAYGLMDNAGSLAKGYALAQATCAGSGGMLLLHVVPNATVNLTAGPLPTCPPNALQTP